MHDCTFHMLTPIGQRNVLQAVDVESQTVLASAHEFSEQYELICMAPLGQSADWGNELVAGAVHGSENHPKLTSGGSCLSLVSYQRYSYQD